MDASYEVLLYYRYFPVADPLGYVEIQRNLCRELGLRGRILVASEGLNGTLSGPRESTARYREWMHAQPETAGLVFKIDPADGHVFGKLSVKTRQEIVTLGLPEPEDIDPAQLTGARLEPAAFREAMDEPGTVILDARNRYESDLGRFRGAVRPPVDHFRELPNWVRENRELLEGKRILTYCTGGVRCEKFSGLLLREGHRDVAQLEGGIAAYARDPSTRGRDFEGTCYVFDERVSVPVNEVNPRVVGRCHHCGAPCERYRNCLHPPCNEQFLCCADCEDEYSGACSAACRQEAIMG